MNPRKLIAVPSSNGLVFNMSLAYGFNTGDYLHDETGGGKTGTATNSPVPRYPGFQFTATSSMYIDIGTGPASVKTVALWVNPVAVNVTDSPIDLNGTDFLTIVNGTLTQNGFAGGTAVLYTDGVAAAVTVTAGAWYHIAITDTVAKDAADFDIGRETANYFDGLIGDVRLYSTVLSAMEMKDLYELQRWRYST